MQRIKINNIKNSTFRLGDQGKLKGCEIWADIWMTRIRLGKRDEPANAKALSKNKHSWFEELKEPLCLGSTGWESGMKWRHCPFLQELVMKRSSVVIVSDTSLLAQTFRWLKIYNSLQSRSQDFWKRIKISIFFFL